jgi:hypothetical protein
MIENVEDSSKLNLHERSQKRMRSHKSDLSSRKRLSYRIDIPAEVVDMTPPLQKVSFGTISENHRNTRRHTHEYFLGAGNPICSFRR